MAPSVTVGFHRVRALLWAVAGLVAFLQGWQDSVALVFVASVYANVVSDWAAAEAADDHRILDRLDEMDAKLNKLIAQAEPDPPRDVALDAYVENALGFRPETPWT